MRGENRLRGLKRTDRRIELISGPLLDQALLPRCREFELRPRGALCTERPEDLFSDSKTLQGLC